MTSAQQADTSGTEGAGAAGSGSLSPEQIEERLRAQREALAASVDEFASRVDPRTQAREAGEHLREQASAKADHLREQAVAGALAAMSHRRHAPGLILDSYLLRAMALSGWAPALDECARCGTVGPHDWFVAQLGGSVCGDCAPAGSARVCPETRQLLSALIAGEWDAVDTAHDAASAAASGLVAAYTQWHLERGLRSLEHVDRTRAARSSTSARSRRAPASSRSARPNSSSVVSPLPR